MDIRPHSDFDAQRGTGPRTTVNGGGRTFSVKTGARRGTGPRATVTNLFHLVHRLSRQTTLL